LKAFRQSADYPPRRRSFVCVGLLLLSYASGVASAATVCQRPTLAQAGQTTERHPRLSWAAVPGATSYRIRVQSRVPDGRVLAFHDTVVNGPEFLPPQPLAEHRAKVTVRLNAICGAETSAETVGTFVIDTSSLCRLEDLAVDKTTLKWPAVAGARSYEVRAYRLGDGRLLASHETRETAAPLALKESAVVSVRPACAAGLGEALYRVVAR
jgi:hypothetical protein